MKTLEMTIDGMTCGHCVRAVSQALGKLEGVQVEQVQVGSAKVQYDEARVTQARITEAVEDEGYAVTPSA